MPNILEGMLVVRWNSGKICLGDLGGIAGEICGRVFRKKDKINKLLFILKKNMVELVQPQ